MTKTRRQVLVMGGNIAALMAEPDIDGALVGSASLEAPSFAQILMYGRM